MRILIAASFVCALCAPPASALPVAKSGAASVSQRSAQVLDIKVKAKGGGKSSHVSSKGRKGVGGGIHPLVGSGDY
jgi:hypothetical protein